MGELRSRDLLEIDDEKLSESSRCCEASKTKSPHKHHPTSSSPTGHTIAEPSKGRSSEKENNFVGIRSKKTDLI
jgi:hypothetical protein